MANRYKLGPAILVTAAFIGPGTVLTASNAGAQYGFSLLWAVAFSVLTAIVLQSMAARLGIISGKGVAEALATGFPNRFLRGMAILLVLGAILFGNSAYQTGNLLGAANGFQLLTGVDANVWLIGITAIATIILWIGRFSIIQYFLTVLVAVMGFVFVLATFQSQPNWGDVAAGFRPSIPTGAEWAVVGLIGTTVVPYNLFLHASAAAQRYGDIESKSTAITHSNWDTMIAIAIGGLVTSALLITAAVTFGGTANGVSIQEIANQLEPSLGNWAGQAFAVGLFAAGLTSSLTAPVAAAYATAGCFGMNTELSNPAMKIVASFVMAIGLAFAMLFGGSPSETIIVAQIANGILLPVIAGFLLYTLNRSELLGDHTNGWLANSLGLIVVLVTVVLASRNLINAWETVQSLLQTG